MTGIDGYDWSVFGGGNPVPGDPDAVRRAARTLVDDADHVRQQNRVLQGSAQDALEEWQGPAASGFSSLVGHLGPQLVAMVAAFEDASAAADTYASALRHAQAKAVTALHQAQAAKADIHSAAAQVASLGGKLDTAAAAYDAATGFGGHEMSAPAPPSTPAAKAHEANLLTAYQSASAELGRADGALSAARSAMAHAVALKDHAVSEAASAAVTFAGAMERAMKSPGHGTGPAGDSFVHFLVGQAPGVSASLAEIPADRVDDAEDALKAASKDMSQAGHDMRTGATAAERSAGAKLMAEARADKAEAVEDLEQAEKLTGVAGGAVGKVSSIFSYSAADVRSDVLERLSDDPAAVSDLDGTLGSLADHTPVLGTVLTGALTVNDIRQGKYLDAGGDVAGFGAAVGTGILLASNPVGWAVAGSIAAGVAVTWGVDNYKTLEGWADDVGHGVSEGFDKVKHVASSVWHDTIGSIFLSPDDASTSRAQSGRSRVETTGDIADPAVDRVVPPEGQGPTLVVWREYGFRRDRVQNNLLIAAVWVAVLVVYLLAESGLRAPSGGELAIGLVPAVGAMLLMQWLTSSPGRFVAAGDVWLATGQTKKPPRPCRRWVRLDDLIGVTIAHRRRFASDTPEYHFEDRDGRRLVVPVRSVRSSPPLQELVAEAVLAHRRHLAGAAELETALRAPADAAGRTTVRSAS